MRAWLALFILLTCCGGGDGARPAGKSYDTRSSLMHGLDTVALDTSAPDTPKDTPHYDLVFDGSDYVISVLIRKLNLLRADNGLGPLAPSQALNAAAQDNSDAIAPQAYIDCSGIDMGKVKEESGFADVYCFVRSVANMDELLSILPVMDGSKTWGVLSPTMEAVGAGVATRVQEATGATLLLYTILFAR